MNQEMIHFTIDGKEVTVPKGTTVYTAATQLGINIPIFCYQDRMPPFGACRVCLVEVEKMPKLQTSCTLVATEGMVVKTQSEPAIKGREGILEFLLINHPLDCPICDRGGECPLQEQALDHGPGESRFFEEKRHFRKPLPLGPVLMLDRERCIICARCTRFGDLIAGDHALEFLERGFKTEVGTPDGGPAESKFIGNTIMICPVGALTSDVYRFRARPWDNEPTNTTCPLCPVGCSMILDARDGEIMRTRSLENRAVNDIWLCDKGWFGYEFTSSAERLTKPLIRKGNSLVESNWVEALSFIAQQIKKAKPNGKIAGWGGNPLTVEENYLFQKLIREGAGVNNVDHRIGMPQFDLAEEGLAPGMEMEIGSAEDLDYAVLLGLDLTEEFPVIWLRLRQAINRGAKVHFFGHFAPEIAPYFANVTLHPPGVELEMIRRLSELSLKGKGALFVGRQYLATPDRAAILYELQKNFSNLNIMEGRGNSMGARFAGMHPELGPYGKVLTQPGLSANQLLETAQNGWDVLYVAGADPAKKFPSTLWSTMRSKLNCLIVQDLFLTETAAQADVVLPTLSFVEKGGSFINIEGRIETLLPGKETPNNIHSDKEIFSILAEKLGVSYDISDFSEKLKPGRLPLGRKAIANKPSAKPPVPGELLATFAHALFDHGVRMNHNSHLVQLVKEPFIRLHPNEAQKRGIQNNASLRINNTVTAKVRVDERVAENTAVLPLGFPEVPVHNLGLNLLNGLSIRLEK